MMTGKVKHEWFQTDSTIALDVFIKNLKQEQLKVEYEAGSVSVTVKLSDSSENVMDFDLWHDIMPSECSFEILSTKIELKLKKAIAGLKWDSLCGDGRSQVVGNMNLGTDKPPEYPTSSKKVILNNQETRLGPH
jgi:suppressor of G2 allele of SKP1